MAHEHTTQNFGRAFLIGCVLNIVFVVVEGIYGIRANSLALLADAGHNLSDVLGLVLAWGAGWLATHRPTKRRTYGMRRSTILAALFNAVFLLVAVGGIVWEAVRRLREPAPLLPGMVMAVAAVGIVINGITAWLFMSGRKHDINIRGAFLHMAADAGVSLGVVLSGLAILATGWVWLDPLTSMIIALVITIGTWGLLRESVNLAMDAVPEGINPAAVEVYLQSLPGVTAVHDLHIWAMSTTHAALTAHLIRPAAGVEDDFMALVGRELHDRFGIEHATIQVEHGSGEAPCDLADVDVV